MALRDRIRKLEAAKNPQPADGEEGQAAEEGAAAPTEE